MTTHRAIQIHNLKDDLESQARVCRRAAFNALQINNTKACAHFIRRASRMEIIAERCAARLAV